MPTKEFDRSRWLEAQLAKVYPVQRTEYCEPFEKPILYHGNDAWYYWVKVVPDPQGFGVNKIRVSPDAADILEGFIPADTLRLERLREKVFDLKLTVLQEAERALRSPDKTDVWSACLPHFVAALSADEVEFLSRMDSSYRNPPAGLNLSRGLAAALGRRSPIEPGGFSNLIELVGHVQKECTIGMMHKTREALGKLVTYERGNPVLCSSSRWPDFDFVDEGYSREVFENAVQTFLEREAKEIVFWPQFHDRVTAAVGEEFNREIVIAIRIKPSVAEQVRRNLASYAEFVKSHLEVSGELPALQLQLTPETADSKTDPKKRLPHSDRVWKAIKALKDYNKKVADGKANKLPVTAILSTHLGVPVESKEVKNLARQLREYRHLIDDSADS